MADGDRVASPLVTDVGEEIAATNLKVIGGLPALTVALNTKIQSDAATRHATAAADEELANTKSINSIRQMFLGSLAKQFVQVEIEEAVSASKMLNADLAEKITSLSAAVNQSIAQMGQIVAVLQQVMKGAQTTIPETGTKPAGT
jgi:hypothetical protein